MDESKRMNQIIEMFHLNYKFIVQDLKSLHKELDWRVNQDDESPSCDIRIGVDFDGNEPNYIILWGDSSYDQRHSEFCGASSIGEDTKFNIEADETLEDIIDQILDQVAQ